MVSTAPQNYVETVSVGITLNNRNSRQVKQKPFTYGARPSGLTSPRNGGTDGLRPR